MTRSHLLSFACGALLMLGLTTVTQSHAQTPGSLYELRMYHANEGKLDAVSARFRDHTVAIFNRLNMKSVGYWTPQDGPEAGKLLIYILQHPSRAEADRNWAKFNSDPEWVKVRNESEANGALISKIDRYFMNPTDYSALK